MADWKTGVLTRPVITEISTVFSEATLMSKLGGLISDYIVWDFHIDNIE